MVSISLDRAAASSSQIDYKLTELGWDRDLTHQGHSARHPSHGQLADVRLAHGRSKAQSEFRKS